MTVQGWPRLSDMAVRLLYGLKNMAIDLCEKMSIMAFRNRMPCTASMSPGELFVLNSQRRFLSSEKAVHHSSARLNGGSLYSIDANGIGWFAALTLLWLRLGAAIVHRGENGHAEHQHKEAHRPGGVAVPGLRIAHLAHLRLDAHLERDARGGGLVAQILGHTVLNVSMRAARWHADAPIDQ